MVTSPGQARPPAPAPGPQPKQSGKSDVLLRDTVTSAGPVVFPEPFAFCETQQSKVPKFHPKSPQGSPDSFVNRRYCKFGKISGNRLPRNGQTRGFVPKRPPLTSLKGGPTERAVGARLVCWGRGLWAGLTVGLRNLLAGSGQGENPEARKGQSCPLPESLTYFLFFSPVPTPPSQTPGPQACTQPWLLSLHSLPSSLAL